MRSGIAKISDDTPAGSGRSGWVPYFILALSLAATAAAAAAVRMTSERQDRGRFDAAVERGRNAIYNRTHVYGASLRNIAALFQTGGIPNRAQFHEYIARLDLRRQYPGIVGIGFSLRVPPGERAKFESVGRENVDPSFRIWPDGPAGAECHTIYYLEPADEPNRRAIGFDMHSEPVRAAAMDAARDRGGAAASGKVELVQDADRPGTPGFLVYMPLYKGKQVPGAVGERREKLYGYIYAPFRAGDLLHGVSLNDPGSVVDFRLYDGDAASPAAMLHDSATYRGAAAASNPRYARVEKIEVAGRPWTVEFITRPTFEQASSRWMVPLVVVVGCAVSVTFFALARSQAAALRQAGRAKIAAEQARLAAEQAKLTAERANAAKDRFLAVLSHELRTPLSPVLAAAGLWRDDPAVPQALRDDMAVIERNVQLEARLIDDLLDLTRIERGKVQLHFEAVDVHAALREIVGMFAEQAAAKRVDLSTALDASESYAWGDPARLRQIFLNLLSNAVKFTAEGGTVEVRSANEGGRLRVEVADSGIGIDAETLPRLFDAFEQGERTVTRRFGGLGLGLSIARSLVEAHGGVIAAASGGDGKGATFTVTLDSVAAPQAVAPVNGESVNGGEGARILLVEDHADTRRVMVKLLSASGYSVTPAGSVKEAIDAAGAERFDLLLSDIGLPDGTGHDVMRHVRERHGMAGIAVSGFAHDDDMRRSREAGFEAHLAKPVDFQKLRETVHAAVSRTRSVAN